MSHRVAVGSRFHPAFVAAGPGAQARVDAEVARWGLPPGGRGTAGDGDAIAAAVRRIAGLGVTSLVFQATADEPDLEGLIAFLGHDVAARLA